MYREQLNDQDEVTMAGSQQPIVKSWWGSISLVLASQVVLGLLIAVTTGLLVMQSRAQALQDAGHELRSLALTLAEQADRAFEAVVLVQIPFLDMVRNANVQTADDFRKRMSSIEVYKELAAHGSGLPQLDGIGLVDADGNLINLSKIWPVPATSVADRAYFKLLKEDPERTMTVSDPIVRRVTHALAVVVGRRIANADGGFLGISYAGILISYFENLYKAVVNDQATAISLLNTDGVLLARYPAQKDAIGKIFFDGSATGRLAASAADTDIKLQTSVADGTERLIAAHKLTHYPMLVAVSTTTAALLTPWHKQATYLITAAVMLELVVVAVGVLMLRQLRSQRLLGDALAARRDAEAELALGQERERADWQLHIQAARFGAALANMSEVVCMFDAADSLLVGNDRLATMLGLPASSIAPGTTLEDLRALLADSSALSPADLELLHGLIIRLKLTGQRASQALDMAAGRRVAVNFAPMENDAWLVTFEDITQQRRAEAKIEHMAHHDALTGLANRLLFHKRLEEALARCRRGDRYAMIYLDLDHFKAVNDTFGHPAGDALLREVTQRLKQQVREVDTVARIGGDEFAILQAIDEPLDTTTLAGRVIEAISAPYDIGGHRVIIGASVGIAIAPDNGEHVDEVVKNADLALYRSKTEGRGRYKCFEPSMDAQMQERRSLEQDLRKALQNEELAVFYQPLIHIASRSVCGFEALLRWRHPQRGMISPAEFIPMAEEIGLIVPLGKWVLRRACADAATWPHHLKVAVNLSPVQFGSQTVVEDVTAALADAGLPPERLELEITETAILADTEAVLVTLYLLRDLGLGIALDDFGTGYSSLSYLQRFPFSKVKIDRSFVGKLGRAGDNDTIVSAMIDLCGRLGMTTTGEGVETAVQLERLAALNCTEAQGFLFSPAQPTGEVGEMLRRLVAEEAIA